MVMTVKVKIPTQLRTLTDGQEVVEAEGTTVEEIILNLEEKHTGLRARLVDESGAQRRFVNIYLGDEDIRFTGGLSAAVTDGAQLSVIPAVAGG
jgi:molybdopterin converting factor small subunit